ncbi:protein DMP6-like [Silene latifolia]|uniref:protein DMP6-like n=1 Tax=Silene latifolia TaxID=37657 RepID=UPI003D7864A2
MNIRRNSMEINQHDDAEQKTPLLRDRSFPDTVERNPIQQAISQTFQSTAHLANLLPTGTVMAFQLLAPIITNVGQCDDAGRVMTSVLVGLCGLSSFLLSFTDSFKDKDGNLCYGFATTNGLWVIDGSAELPPSMAAKYRLRFMDFVHAFMSVFVSFPTHRHGIGFPLTAS